MKVYIGPYRRWVGPYQVADFLRKCYFPEKFCDWFKENVSPEPFEWFYKTFQNQGERTLKIRVDDYDKWSLDCTLSPIIRACLIKFKEDLHGVPVIDQEDLPDDLKYVTKPDHDYNDEDFDKWTNGWNWILDEMINAFDNIDDENCYRDNDEEYKRKENGRRLFAKYYLSLWD